MIFRLKGDVTRFGRHSGNDYYLDSSYLVHFISRWHAEVHRVHQGDDVRYMMRDNSLNGTYVNEVRVSWLALRTNKALFLLILTTVKSLI